MVKVGRGDAVRRDYQGWLDFARRQPNRDAFAKMDTPIEADFGAIVIIDFVGTEDRDPRSLAEQVDGGYPFLAEVVSRVTHGVLRSLHECLTGPDHAGMHATLPQGEALARWVRPPVVKAARARLETDPATCDTWAAEDVHDPACLLTLRNRLPELLAGALPCAESEIRLPIGAVHGDPNFDNVFVAHADPGESPSVALIDFEWCREGPPESPYEDLANIECELLFGNLAPLHRRAMAHAVALGDVFLSGGAPVIATDEPDRGIYAAIRIVRTRVAELAERAGARTQAELEAYGRGYLVALLGQATRYLGFDVPGDDTRAEIVRFCQLLAARLAEPRIEDATPPFTVQVTPSALRNGTVVMEPDAYRLAASDAGSYAGLLVHEPFPAGGFDATCELEVSQATHGSWIAFSLGADPAAPQRSGLSALLRPGVDSQIRTGIVSHVDSRHSLHGSVLRLSTEAVGVRLRMQVQRGPARFGFTVETGDGIASATVAIPPGAYRGPLALMVHEATTRVTSLRVRLAEPG